MSLISNQPSVFLPELIKLLEPFTKACCKSLCGCKELLFSSSTDGAIRAEASTAILMITLNQEGGFKLLCLLAGFCSVDHENPPLKDPLTEFSVMVEEGKIKMVERRNKEGEIFMA